MTADWGVVVHAAPALKGNSKGMEPPNTYKRYRTPVAFATVWAANVGEIERALPPLRLADENPKGADGARG